MTDSNFASRLTGRPARTSSEGKSAFTQLLTEPHMGGEQAAIALLTARVDALLDHPIDQTRHYPVLTEAKRTRRRRTRKVSEIEKNCSKLDELVRAAFAKRVKGIGESVQAGRRSSRTVRLRESCSIASSGMCSCRRCIGGHC